MPELKEPISFTIDAHPVSKKNSQQIFQNPKTKRPFIVPSKPYKAYLKAAEPFIREARQFGRDYDSPMNITAKFFVGSARRCDLANFINALADVLVFYKVIHDDSYDIVVGWDGSRMAIDRVYPRTEILMTPIEERGYQLSLTEEQLQEEW